MSDYIKREDALKAFANAHPLDYNAIAYATWIKNIPAADVVERKVGRWEYTEMYYDDYAWVCSVCGETWVLNDGTPAENNMNYCPNCGASMQSNISNALDALNKEADAT